MNFQERFKGKTAQISKDPQSQIIETHNKMKVDFYNMKPCDVFDLSRSMTPYLKSEIKFNSSIVRSHSSKNIVPIRFQPKNNKEDVKKSQRVSSVHSKLKSYLPHTPLSSVSSSKRAAAEKSLQTAPSMHIFFEQVDNQKLDSPTIQNKNRSQSSNFQKVGSSIMGIHRQSEEMSSERHIDISQKQKQAAFLPKIIPFSKNSSPLMNSNQFMPSSPSNSPSLFPLNSYLIDDKSFKKVQIPTREALTKSFMSCSQQSVLFQQGMDNIDANIKQTAELLNNKKTKLSSHQNNNPSLTLPSNVSNSPSFREQIQANMQKKSLLEAQKETKSVVSRIDCISQENSLPQYLSDIQLLNKKPSSKLQDLDKFLNELKNMKQMQIKSHNPTNFDMKKEETSIQIMKEEPRNTVITLSNTRRSAHQESWKTQIIPFQAKRAEEEALQAYKNHYVYKGSPLEKKYNYYEGGSRHQHSHSSSNTPTNFKDSYGTINFSMQIEQPQQFLFPPSSPPHNHGSNTQNLSLYGIRSSRQFPIDQIK